MLNFMLALTGMREILKFSPARTHTILISEMVAVHILMTLFLNQQAQKVVEVGVV
jgi:hypothetical protein